MPKFQVDALDRYRVLLTETLPYDTPLFFSNRALYRLHRRLEKGRIQIPKLIERIYFPASQGATQPYEYSIAKSVGSVRVLAIVHPAVQRRFVSFYEDFGDYIAFLCSRSSFSLRAPSRIASAYYERDFIDPEATQFSDPTVEEEKTAAEFQERSAASYFVYRRYSLLHKFFESDEFLEHEKRFAILLRFDISKCFESIYTHTISWAIKSKEFSNNTKNNDGFDSTFDELMRHSNYDETHGIVIGPESSRIFAEIIFQWIDESIRKRLAEEAKLVFKADYYVGRYIDDFFVFANSPDVCRTVFRLAEEELRKFKLYVNQEKTSQTPVPFTSPQSIAKEKLKAILAREFESTVEPQSLRDQPAAPTSIFKKYSGAPSSAKLISEIKCEVKSAGAAYYGTVAYVLGIIRSQLARVFRRRLRSRLKPEATEAVSYIIRMLDVSFFLYAMDMRVRPTYLVCQIACICKRAAHSLGTDALDIVVKKLLDETVEAIYRQRSRQSRSYVELDDLLMLLRYISPTFEIPEDRLASCFGMNIGDVAGIITPAPLGYFELASLLYFIGPSKSYDRLRAEILLQISRKTDAVERPSTHSELVLLFADALACPNIPATSKEALVQKMSNSVFAKASSANEVKEIIDFCTTYLHFLDWEGAPSLEYVLQKKELRTPYGE